MEQNLSRNDLFALLVLLCHGGYFWVLPSFVTKENGSMGIVSMLLGAGIGLLILGLAYVLSRKSAGQPIFQYFSQIMPRPLGQLAALAIWLYLAIFLILCLAFFTEMMSSRLLIDTPRWIISGVFLFLIGRLVSLGLVDIARFSFFALASLFFLMLMLILGNVPLFELIQALPLTVENKAAFGSNMLQAGNAYSIVLCLLFILPRVRPAEKNFSWSITALLLAVLFFAIMTFLAMGVFGQNFAQTMFWMHLEQAKMIQLGPYFERVEAIYVVLWMTVIFAASSILIYCTNHSLMQIIRRPLTVRAHWLLIIFFWLCCNFLESMEKIILLLKYFNQVFFWLMLGGMLLAFCFAQRNKKSTNS